MVRRINDYSAEIAVVVVAAALLTMVLTGQPGALGEAVQGRLNTSFSSLVSITVLVGIPSMFILERVLPAREEQTGVTPPVLLDMIYMFVLRPASAGAMVFMLIPFRWVLDTYFSFLIIDSTRDWPILVQALLGFVLVDFVSWINHVLKHKVSFLWRFHIIHHSQTRLNMFTPDRVHPLESFFGGLVDLLPLFFFFPTFTGESQNTLLLILFFSWFTKLQHANIRLNLGPLRYIFVTPQSHRVHHSTEPQHFNSNYGNIFCWDRLAGFQCDDDTSYPTTGINDLQFPQPKSWSFKELSSSLVGQMLYPFDRDAVRKASEGSPHDAQPATTAPG